MGDSTPPQIPGRWAGAFAWGTRPQTWRWLFFAYVGVSVLLNLWGDGGGAAWLTATDPVAKSRLVAAHDADIAGFLLPGLRSKPTLLSTLDWWHGTWAGIVPFWRPLTSLAFWLEYHTLTPDRFDRWMLVSYAGHLVFVALLVLLVKRLTGRWGVAALTALLFAGSIHLWPLNWAYALLPREFSALSAPCDIALRIWKDQPEAWTGICTLTAILLALRERWAGALAWAVLGVCFKESGWFIFPIVFVVLAFQKRLGTVPRWVYPATAASVVVLVLLRVSAGPAVLHGYHYNSNGYWLLRYCNAVSCVYLLQLFSPDGVAEVLAALLLALLAWRRGPFVPRVLLAFAAFALCAGLYSLTHHSSYAVGWVVLLAPEQSLFVILASLAWLFVAWRLLRNPISRRPVPMMLFIIFISAIPVAAAGQVLRHVLYLAWAFQACLVALGLAAVADDAARARTKKKTDRCAGPAVVPNPASAKADNTASSPDSGDFSRCPRSGQFR